MGALESVAADVDVDVDVGCVADADSGSAAVVVDAVTGFVAASGDVGGADVVAGGVEHVPGHELVAPVEHLSYSSAPSGLQLSRH